MLTIIIQALFKIEMIICILKFQMLMFIMMIKLILSDRKIKENYLVNLIATINNKVILILWKTVGRSNLINRIDQGNNIQSNIKLTNYKMALNPNQVSKSTQKIRMQHHFRNLKRNLRTKIFYFKMIIYWIKCLML